MSNTNYQVKEFTEHLNTLGKSKNTITSYVSDVQQFFNSYVIFNRINITLYKKSLSEMSSTTINRKLSSLKQYNEYLLYTKQIQSILIIKSDYIRIQDQGNPTSIPEKTILKFLGRVKAKHHTYQSRNIALIFLIANTAIRREESCDVLLSNVHLSNSIITIIGKGNKERTVMLNSATIKILEEYLIDRASYKHANSKYLFVSERGNKLTKESINNIFDFYSTPKCKVNPHALRHNWCTTMAENNILNLIEIKNQAGHSSLLTTELYTHARQDKMIEKIKNYSIG